MVLLAAGAMIGAVIGTLSKAFKDTGQVMGQGQCELGATLKGLLPGLPGQTAGQGARFFTEHAWLLILAAAIVYFKCAA